MRHAYLWPLALLLSAARAFAFAQPSQSAQLQVASTPALQPTDLTDATPEALLKVHSQLSSLQGSDRYAVTENAVLNRDAGTFTFAHGQLACTCRDIRSGTRSEIALLRHKTPGPTS